MNYQNQQYHESYALFSVAEAESEGFRERLESSELDAHLLSNGSDAPCFAKIHFSMSFIDATRDWDIRAIGEIPHTGGLQDTSDLRHTTGYRSPIFSARKDPFNRNCMLVTSITLLDGLRQKGIGTWVVDRALSLCFPGTGPDPWITGELSPVDEKNEKRNPFWQRHVADRIETQPGRASRFKGPWVHAFNRHLAAFRPVLLSSTGSKCSWNDTAGVLYEVEGRKAFKPVSGHERLCEGRSGGSSIWQERTSP